MLALKGCLRSCTSLFVVESSASQTPHSRFVELKRLYFHTLFKKEKPPVNLIVLNSSLKVSHCPITATMTNKLPKTLTHSSSTATEAKPSSQCPILTTSNIYTNNYKAVHYRTESNGNSGARHLSTSSKHLTSNTSKHKVDPRHTLANALQFKTMAGVQSLVTSPTRESIELIREQLREKKAKHNENQEIKLVKDEESGIATVIFKSGAKNAISAKMMCDMLDVLDELECWHQGKGVIICGHNNFFCSGGDLVSVRELANYADGNKMATLMQYNLARLQSLPMITMALIEGKAIGGGAEIATTTDLRVMTENAKFGYVHVRVGICSAWGGGSRLVQLVGPSRAIELMASGRLVGAHEALSMGLANFVIDDTAPTNNNNNNNVHASELNKSIGDDFAFGKAKEYLRQHLIGAKSTIMAIKALVNAARCLPLERALVAECQILSSTWGKEPHLEALNNNVKHRDT